MVQAVGGALTVSGGTITFSNSVMDTNPLNLTSLSISGSGMVNFSSGVAIDTGTLKESGGTLTGTDTITVSGLTTWTGGTMSGTGKTDVASTGTLALSGSGSDTLERTLENDGAGTWTGSVKVLMNGGTFTNDGTVTANSTQALQAVSNGGVSLFVNNGTFTRQGSGTTTIGVPLNNTGTVNVVSGTLSCTGSATTLNDPGTIESQTGTTLSFTGNLLGATRNANSFNSVGTVLLNGSGTSASPQQFEVMSQDSGVVAAGFTSNFAYGTLVIGSNNYVQLVDLSKNTNSGNPEALYVNVLVVPLGSTLDLNGLHLYANVVSNAGTISGGSVSLFLPTSSVNPLPAFSPGTFSVSWSGQDDALASGIASYTIFVSDNGGAFTPWQTNTTQTSITYTGVNGHTYAFYSVATDKDGNVQPTPTTSGQPSTIVDTIPPTSSIITALPQYSPDDFTVSWTGQDNTGGSGVASYNVYVSTDDGMTWAPWLTNTPQTSATYFGQSNTAYAFYVTATDNAGNSQTYAPVIEQPQTQTADYQTFLPAELENTTTAPTLPTSNEISSQLSGHFSDANTQAKPGIAISETTGTGTWEFSSDGKTWTNVGTVSPSQALLLPQADYLYFVPGPGWVGQADLFYQAWDGEMGQAGGTASVVNPGSDTGFSTTVADLSASVLSSGTAPTWTATSAVFTPILPNSGQGAGQTVAGVFGSVFSDGSTPTAGIAVTGLTGTQSGTWEYKLSGSSNWVPFGTVSSVSALLLSGNDSISFVPNSSFTGPVTLQAYAWDGSTGIDGGTANLSGTGTGGNTPFSGNLLTATLAVNDAPVLGSASPTLTAASENTPSAAVTVSTLVATQTDPDSGASKGLALVGTTGPGTWQFSLNAGLTWQAVGAVSASSALLLPSTAELRFIPTANTTGSATLTYCAGTRQPGRRAACSPSAPPAGPARSARRKTPPRSPSRQLPDRPGSAAAPRSLRFCPTPIHRRATPLPTSSVRCSLMPPAASRSASPSWH